MSLLKINNCIGTILFSVGYLQIIQSLLFSLAREDSKSNHYLFF